jgi:hypothetical protein
MKSHPINSLIDPSAYPLIHSKQTQFNPKTSPFLAQERTRPPTTPFLAQERGLFPLFFICLDIVVRMLYTLFTAS